jgi:hypothetical protein
LTELEEAELFMNQPTGAERAFWDLSIFYAQPDDPAILRDLAALRARAERLAERHRASFVPRCFEVLSAGGSDAPEDILAKVGVDLTDPSFWSKACKMVSDPEALTVEVL